MSGTRTRTENTREVALRVAERVADAYREQCAEAKRQGKDVHEMEVAVRAIKRAADYFDWHALEILHSQPPNDTEALARLQGLLGAVGQAVGAALFLAEMLPPDVLRLLERSRMRGIDPSQRERELRR